eukprot:4381812-Alexandrium_andersonii.AAC.1
MGSPAGHAWHRGARGSSGPLWPGPRGERCRGSPRHTLAPPPPLAASEARLGLKLLLDLTLMPHQRGMVVLGEGVPGEVELV